jgi:NAD-dependent deacetylase
MATEAFHLTVTINEKKLVVLTGAGISAESGIKPSAHDGWEGHNVQDVATPKDGTKNQALVLDFIIKGENSKKSTQFRASLWLN